MTQPTNHLSRRAFLSSTGALVVALAAPADWAEAAANGAATRPPLKPDQLSSYITIEPDGTVVAYYGKIDGGQGLGTVDRADGRRGDRRCLSSACASSWATAALHARHGRRERRDRRLARRHDAAPDGGRSAAAADRDGEPTSSALPAERLTVTDGVVHATADATKRISYAELIGGRYFDDQVKWNGRLEQRPRSRGRGAAQEARPSSRSSASRCRAAICPARCSARWRWSTTCGCPACCMRA